MLVELLYNFFSSGNFIPHGHCYLWKPELVWLHILANTLIALSYYSIPLTLIYFVRKRDDIPFKVIFLLFGAFIISCGTTHLMEVWTLWHPVYWLSGAMKAITALISLYTAITLIPLVPQALALPSPAQLEAAYMALKDENAERQRVEQELRQYKETLEELVEQRTAELAKTNEQLQQEIVQRQQSQEKMAELLKAVKSANQDLNDFAYVVSHDLKAPLRGISSLSEWLLSDYGDQFDDEGQELVRLLISRVKKMYALIDGILQYSRAGSYREEKTQVNLNDVVRDVIDLLAPPENIQIEIISTLPIISAETTRIKQIFQNLFSNAIKFIDKPQGRIIINCTEDNSYWQFIVADNGPGIEEKYFTKIFQMFQKLSNDDNSDSTGIGLSLVKKIVELYGGTVWVESEVGQGSKFFFTLRK
ncbi:GHKL domain-containing protein [Tolypothrix sp. LEGE 11397]|uniref:sensor histidine kinase n=2 Tax=unclassified Tolypothrix TaxID=2649714 RepID=UPI0009DA50BD|nr:MULTISPECIES: ATP-binding protein [unclassified Tolypothrix]MBE9083440.1 GHKL domain-containing protein [Tolypothrix sp. LEGE 11397]UYD30163.1 GHKL domain-containing protein [Tolypothrix sp. PCC 7712]UYD37904.1 GHKL domain-containing protein [Tolypothrix sp. PCC 7601]